MKTIILTWHYNVTGTMRVRGGADSAQQLYSGRTPAVTGPVWALAMTRVHVSPRLVVRVSLFISALDALARCLGYAISLDSLGEDGCVPSLFMRKLRHGVWVALIRPSGRLSTAGLIY